VLLLAINAHGFNGLRSKALLSRQRSRVRAPSSPPDSKGLRSDLACDIKVQKGTSSDFAPHCLGWITHSWTSRGSRWRGPLLHLGLVRADVLPIRVATAWAFSRTNPIGPEFVWLMITDGRFRFSATVNSPSSPVW